MPLTMLAGAVLIARFWGRQVPSEFRDRWNREIGTFTDHLPVVSQYLRRAYNQFPQDDPNPPDTWEDLFERAPWPEWRPNKPYWEDQLDDYGTWAVSFVRGIYPAHDSQELADRSTLLSRTEFEEFAAARSSMKNIARTWGKRLSADRNYQDTFREFLAEDVAGYHSKHIKFLLYCEVALWDAFPHRRTGSSAMFDLESELKEMSDAEESV